MKKFLAILITALCALNVTAAERNLLTSRVSKEQLKDMLVPDRKWVSLPSYSDREGWEAMLGDTRDAYIRRGEKALAHTWPRVKATDYLEYERSGNRAIMESPLNANNTAVADLLMAELAEGKGRFIDQLINGVYAAAEMTSWALSAHIPPYTRGRSLQPYDRPVIDLVAGDMGGLYSWVYYFMHSEFDRINPEISRRLRHELETRVIEPFLSYDKWWWDASRTYKGGLLNNWTPWCHSNVLMAAMLMENDPERYAEIVYFTMLGMDRFLNYIKGDGACEEGPSYWGHAAGKALDYIELLSLATGGRIDISDEKMIKDMGEYIARSYVGDGWVVNFADASAKGGGDPYLIYRFGKAVDSDLLKNFAAMLYADRKTPPSNGRDIFRTFAALGIKPELDAYKADFRRPASSWYPETEFRYLSTPQNLFFASKGGFNAESHNHNDVGTFSLWADNYPIIIDAGVGTYTRQTFSKERYSIWTMQSEWHNLPVINGFGQSDGKEFRASDVKATKNGFSLNLAQSYPAEAAVRRWDRAYALDGRVLKITDSFELDESKAPAVINFLSWGDIDTSRPGEVAINARGHKALLTYNPAQFDVTLLDKPLDDPRLSNVWGKKITRISLTEKKSTAKGKYTFTIKAL